MRVVLQRVSQASVAVDGAAVGSIGEGLLLLIGITNTDTQEVAKKLAEKISKLRIFEDENGKMNRSILESGGKILAISQFTLYADCWDGNRPSFTAAARPEHAKPLYEYLMACLRECGLEVETGVFGAHMKVSLVNDGPVTIVLDSDAYSA